MLELSLAQPRLSVLNLNQQQPADTSHSQQLQHQQQLQKLQQHQQQQQQRQRPHQQPLRQQLQQPQQIQQQHHLQQQQQCGPWSCGVATPPGSSAGVNRIIGGEEAGRHAYPWMARLLGAGCTGSRLPWCGLLLPHHGNLMQTCCAGPASSPPGWPPPPSTASGTSGQREPRCRVITGRSYCYDYTIMKV